MSLTQAITEVKARLDGLSLTEDPDKREFTLAASSKTSIDGHYKLKVDSVGNPWPELSLNANAWYCQVELEVSTIMSNDQTASTITADTRARAIRESLHYTGLTYGFVFDFEEPRRVDVPNNPRLRLWVWRFKLRYQE